MPLAQTPDGALLEWEEHGSGAPLLLMGGQGVSRRTWDVVLPRLTSDFRVLTFDSRGIGESTTGDKPIWTTRALAADAVAVLDAAGESRAHIVGHSMGGRVAQWTAIDRPDRVVTLALISSTGGDERGQHRPPEVTAALAGGDPAVLAPYFFGEFFRAAHPEAVRMLGRKSVPLRIRRGHFHASSTHDAWNELPRILVPTLVVHGADDEITLVQNGRDLAGAIADAEYLEVAGGHGIHLEDPTVIDAVAAFARTHAR